MTALLDTILGAVTGTIVFCLWWLIQRAGSYAARRAHWQRWSDRTLELAHRIARAHVDVLEAEEELAAHIARAPEHQLAAFGRRVQGIAGSVAPLVLEQLRRFRLTEPPPMVEAVPVAQDEPVVTTVDVDAWGDEP